MQPAALRAARGAVSFHIVPLMDSSDTVRRIAIESYSRLLAIIASKTNDIATAEDALSDAFAAALERWPVEGAPDAPEGWLLAVARRRLIDEHRRRETRLAHEPHLQRAAETAALQAVDDLTTLETIPDERLKMLFVCAHPAIAPSMRTPLMLQTVLGVDAARIASAFLVAPAAMGQRLVRAKAKIRQAGIPFLVPEPPELAERLHFVLEAVYAAFGLAWETGVGSEPEHRGLRAEAISLSRLLVELLPLEAEAAGLLALLLHCEARQNGRRSPEGEYVPLSKQDTSRWSKPLIEEAESVLRRAAMHKQLGRFQLEAAIQSAHTAAALACRSPAGEIAILYRELIRVSPSVGAQVGLAAALYQEGDGAGALAALAEIDPRAVEVYQPFWAVRGHALLRVGRREESRAAFLRAAGLAQDEATRRFLLRASPSSP